MPSLYQHSVALQYYLHDVQQHDLLRPEEEKQLFDDIRNGNKAAKDRMLLANLRLVIRASSNFRFARVCREDLIAEGNIGLMHAIEKFDSSLGFRFSTYAVHWIMDAMRRFVLDHGRDIRLPAYQGKRLQQLARLNNAHQSRHGKMASVDYLAEQSQQSCDQVRELLPWIQPEGSLDMCSDDDLCRCDNSPEQDTVRDDLCDRVRVLTQRLSTRERFVLTMRFTGNDKPSQTFEQIAADLGVTRERARQIQHEAMAKLKRWMKQEGIEDDT